MNTSELLSRLNKVKKTGNKQWQACCPAHNDRNPSLSITEKDGKILLHCFTGCTSDDICNALQLKQSDLFLNSAPTYKTTQKKDLIRTHIYRDIDGNIVAKKDMYKEPNEKKSAIWSRYENGAYKTGLKGIEPPLYNIQDVVKELDTVYIVEGEKDADTVKKMGYTTTTLPKKKWITDYEKYLKDKNIVVIRDVDEAGERNANIVINGVLPIAKTVKKINPATMCEGLPSNGDISDVVAKIGIEQAKQALINALSDTPIITQKVENVKPTAAETEKKPPFTIEALEEYLKEKNIKYRLNVITHKIDIVGFENENQEQIQANIYAILYSDLQLKFNKSCTQNNIREYLNVLASRNCYNPILEHLDSLKWDENSRIDELYDIMNIKEDDSLSRILIFKWLYQTLALLYNTPDEPFGADGCLVLQGEQGIGKTTLFRTLAMNQKYFKSGTSIDFRDKDTYIRALSCWIAELGEIESTFKSDVERLKAFITQEQDEFRRPYGRGDETPIRRTSLCGTCNNTEFLIDVTGNRRWWTVPVDNIDLDKLKKLNVPQLWKEIQFHIENQGLQGFRLTADERKELNERNSQHEKKLKGQQEIEDILSKTSNEKYTVTLEYMTVTDFKSLYSDELRIYSSVQVGKVLDKLGYKTVKKRLNGSAYPSKVKLLPHIRYSCTN